MANRRMLNCGISLNERFGSLSPCARLLFIGMITTADDDGRLKGSSLYLKAKVFPYDNFTTQQLSDWKNEIISAQLATHYVVDNIEYFFLNGWLEHQTIRQDRYTESTLPQPPDNQVATNGLPSVDHPLENRNQVQAQYSIGKNKVSIVKCSNNICEDKPPKKQYGEFGNISLTDHEYEKLKVRFNSHLPDLIETMSNGIECKGYKYKNHYAALLNWAKLDEKRQTTNGNRHQGNNRDLPTTYTDPEEFRAEARRKAGLPPAGTS